jgi:hypothetical protein
MKKVFGVDAAVSAANSLATARSCSRMVRRLGELFDGMAPRRRRNGDNHLWNCRAIS